eukprot:8342503-Alexandrium_andersonii.AAC.1
MGAAAATAPQDSRCPVWSLPSWAAVMMFSRPLGRTASVRLAGSEAFRARLTSLLRALMTTASEL